MMGRDARPVISPSASTNPAITTTALAINTSFRHHLGIGDVRAKILEEHFPGRA